MPLLKLGALVIERLYIGSRVGARNNTWLLPHSLSLNDNRLAKVAEEVPTKRWFVINVTKETTNYYEGEEGFVYKRISVRCPILLSRLDLLR